MIRFCQILLSLSVPYESDSIWVTLVRKVEVKERNELHLCLEPICSLSSISSFVSRLSQACINVAIKCTPRVNASSEVVKWLPKMRERIRKQKKEMKKFLSIIFYYYLDCFPSALELSIFLDLWLFLFPYWCLTLTLFLHTMQPKHHWVSSEYMCKVNLFCLPLGFASFPSEHPDSITSSVFEGYTQAHILTYAQLTDTNTNIMTHRRHWPENSNCCL